MPRHRFIRGDGLSLFLSASLGSYEARACGCGCAMVPVDSVAIARVLMRPRVVQVDRERNPPNQIVRQAEQDRGAWPCAGPNQSRQSNRTENLSEQSYRGEQPTAFGPPRDFKVDDSVETHDHSQAREDRRMIQRRHFRKAKQPLRIVNAVNAPGDVVNAGGDENQTMKFATANVQSFVILDELKSKN